MTQIISAIQQKGGVGKSTMVKTIAGRMVREKAKVLIIDTDPQQSSAKWAERTEWDGLDHLELMNEEELYDVIEKVAAKYDMVLIDTAGYDSRMSTYAITVSDLILIPTNGALDDVQGAVKTWKHIEAVTRRNDNPPEVKIIFWKVKPNSAVYRHAKTELENVNAPTLEGAVNNLTGFDKMTWNGGLPEGVAKQAGVSFIYELRKAGLLKYKYQEAA